MHWGPVIVFVPQLIISFGNGLLLPGAISGAVSVRPQAAGTAAGIIGFTQMALGAAITQYAGTLLAESHDRDAAGAADGRAGRGAGDLVRAAGAAASGLSSPRACVYRCGNTHRERRHDHNDRQPACRPAPRSRAVCRGSPRAETLDELYEKAKAEKEVVFYSGGPAAPHENRAKLFMQQFPGIEVKVTGGFSNVLNERIEEADGGQEARRRHGVLPDRAGLRDLEDSRASCSTSSPTASSRSIRTSAIHDGAYMSLSAPTR